MKTKILLITLGFISSLPAAHAANFKMQNIKVAGNGCPSESTQIVMVPDLSGASILFQRFESHVPLDNKMPGTDAFHSSQKCNLFLEIKLPKNQKLDSFEISYDMRGHTSLDTGVSGNFKSYLISTNGLGTDKLLSIFFQQPLQEKNWNKTSSNQEQDFLFQTTKSLPVISNCYGGNGDDKVSIHLQYQVESQIQKGFEKTKAEGTITVDSSDLTGGIKLRAHTSECRDIRFPLSLLGANGH